MPLEATGAEDQRRARRRAATELFTDRVVKQSTRNYRKGLLDVFSRWLAESYRLTLDELVSGNTYDADFICEILVNYGREMYYAGKAYGKFSETVNGITALRPSLRKQISAVWDLAFNWVADEPHEHHPALPLSVLLAVSALALLWGWVREAAVLLISWTGLLRIGEVFSATRAELILPSDSAPGVRSALLKILQPKTRGRAAKHQVARIDHPDVIEFLEALFAEKDPKERLWIASPQTMRRRFSQLQQALGIDTKRTSSNTPYDLASLRPGGATFMLQSTEDAELVRRRGRWISSRVLEVYLQEASVNTHHQRLSGESRKKIGELAASFSRILSKSIFLLQTRIPSHLWPWLW
eukprot:Skav219660  [mRNA]  locus=scaffold1257:38988:40049:+ [translate_table: standard]